MQSLKSFTTHSIPIPHHLKQDIFNEIDRAQGDQIALMRSVQHVYLKYINLKRLSLSFYKIKETFLIIKEQRKVKGAKILSALQ